MMSSGLNVSDIQNQLESLRWMQEETRKNMDQFFLITMGVIIYCKYKFVFHMCYNCLASQQGGQQYDMASIKANSIAANGKM